jgi:hypothetical protein
VPELGNFGTENGSQGVSLAATNIAIRGPRFYIVGMVLVLDIKVGKLLTSQSGLAFLDTY